MFRLFLIFFSLILFAAPFTPGIVHYFALNGATFALCERLHSNGFHPNSFITHPPELLPAKPNIVETYSQQAGIGSSQANWDEQIGLTFTQSFVSLSYNVTAVAQTDQNGYGPAYLLNGLTDTGYWYQVGLSYDWPYTTGGYYNGFAMNYEVFSPQKTPVYPGSGGGLASLSGPVNPNDKVLLSLSIKGGFVVMSVYDWNTGATATQRFSSESSSYFEGLTSGNSNQNGFFTGLMTEQYHTTEYTGGEEQVTFTESESPISSAWMWIDEWNTNTSQIAFSDSTTSPVVFSNPNVLVSYQADGAVEYADGYEFLTGESQLVLDVTYLPILADVGTPAVADLDLTVTNGTPPFTTVTFLDGRVAGIFTSSNSTFQIMDNLGNLSAGSHTLSVEVIDSKGLVAASKEIAFYVNLDPSVNIVTNGLSFDVGQTVNITTDISGGTPPYNVVLYLNGARQLGENSVRVEETGINIVYANVTDGAGYIVTSNELILHVQPDPVVDVNLSRYVTDVGIPVNISETVSGGTPPYTVVWFVNGTLLSSNQNTSFSPSASGKFVMDTITKDSAGYVIESGPLELQVNPPIVLLSYSVTPYSTNFFLSNNTATFDVSVKGGTLPYNYTWLLNGVALATTSQPRFTYSLGAMGVNQLGVTVEDGAGATIESSSVYIQYSFDFAHIAEFVLSVVLVIALFVAVLLATQRRKVDTVQITSPPGMDFIP